MDQSCGQVSLQSEAILPKQFTFDGVYYMDATAEQIYNDIVYPLVEVSNEKSYCFTVKKSSTRNASKKRHIL